GAVPFQCWENRVDDDNNQYGGFKPKKDRDPDVWEPPDDLPKYKKNNKGYNQPKNIQRPGSKQVGGRPGSNAYGKKPSTAGNANQKKGGKDGKDDDKKDPKEGKSAYFLSVYPEGVGPDSELIEMIEKEVVEHNPAVSFEDIAELEGAKRTLQEAVILPLLMPDFFRGIRRPWKGVLLYGPVKIIIIY
ncbi:MAG: hypothetical protein MJ252_30570, partial [archaeon]|nr:hypothetical protein [archaeon]